MTDAVAKKFNLNELTEAVRGNAAAIRSVTRLEPAGQPSDKVFPPTYQGGVYATEMRRINGQEVKCVLLDSVQSQANRMEQALLAAITSTANAKEPSARLSIPLLSVEFADFPDIGRITALDAPHRIADAIFRDSELGGVSFRESADGKRFEAANMRNATALFELCPTALIFGTWDSTGSQGGLGNKFARAIVSEVIGINAQIGVRTGGRLDPLGVNLKAGKLFKHPTDDWSFEAIPIPKKKKDGTVTSEPVELTPSEINHSNIPPDMVRAKKDIPTPNGRDFIVRADQVLPGGVTIDYAEQTTVFSLAALRRLQFPGNGQHSAAARETAARTVLAALALAAITLQREQDYFLRSRCHLIPSDDVTPFEIVRTAKSKNAFILSSSDAVRLLNEAVTQATTVGFNWQGAILLQPSVKLVELVRRSREGGEPDEGGTTDVLPRN